MNLGTILAGAKAVANHPITQGGSLAALISGGLYAAQYAGLAIPSVAFSAGPLLGYLLYRVLPKKIQTEIDDAAKEVVDVVTTIPNTYSEPTDFPSEHKGVGVDAPPSVETNINKGA